MGTGSFPGVKSGRGVTLTLHHILVPLVMKQYSYTSTPPMGRMACTELQFLYKGALHPYLFNGSGMSGEIALGGRQNSVCTVARITQVYEILPRGTGVIYRPKFS